jgi:hypothetical protein
MLNRGFLTGGGFYPSLPHQEHHITAYINAAESVFAEMAAAIQQADVLQRLGDAGTQVRHSGFTRLA